MFRVLAPTRSVAWCLLVAACLMLTGVATAAAANSALLRAVKDRDGTAVRALVKRGADVNAREADGTTALHWAVHRNDPDVTRVLISAGARVDVRNDLGVTPLWLACLNGSPGIVEVLLRSGADGNSALPSGETVLLTAARTGNVEVVTALIGAGAHVDAVESTRGQTPLMWAVANGHIAVVRALLAKGANVNASSTSGFRPLMFAARGGNLELGRLLIDTGADVNDTAADGTDALLVAVVRGHLSFARLMLENGGQPNRITAGYTALHWAVGEWASQMNFDYRLDEGEWSVLGGLPSSKKAEAVKMLLDFGADINARVVKAPFRYGVSMVKPAFVVGGTPFLLAATAGESELMRLLLANGADPSIATNDGTTPLMLAAGLTHYDAESRVPESRHLEAVHLLLDLGAEVNAINETGNTALHGAAFGGFNSIIEVLVHRGADLNPKNKDGQTPLGMAEGTEVGMMVYSRPATAAVLRKFGATSDAPPLSGDIVIKPAK